MEQGKRELRGSPPLDSFMHWHKKLSSGLYMLDFDAVGFEMRPYRGIPFSIDFKDISKNPGCPGNLTFAEVGAYNELLSWGVQKYILEGLWLGNYTTSCPRCGFPNGHRYKNGSEIYLVCIEEPADNPFQYFNIRKYNGGNPRPHPPEVDLELVEERITGEEYATWEKNTRNEWTKKQLQITRNAKLKQAGFLTLLFPQKDREAARFIKENFDDEWIKRFIYHLGQGLS